MSLKNNKELKQFQLAIEEHLVYIEYIEVQNKIYLTHTEVPKALEGKGHGSNIVKLVLEDIKSRNLLLVPLCPFVAAYLKRHPEWQDLLMPGFNVS